MEPDNSKTLEMLFMLVDNYTLYRMSAIISAIATLSKNRFADEVQAKICTPGKDSYYNGSDMDLKELDFNVIMNEICNRANLQDETDGYLRFFDIYEPTEEQLRILSGLFTYVKCGFMRMFANTMYPARITWNWYVKVDDLNLRTKLGRAEKARREEKSKEEAIALLFKIRGLVRTDFLEKAIKQDMEQKAERDALIPVGKKNAVEMSGYEYDIIMKKLELGGFWAQDMSSMLRVWKTPSGVRHREPIKN